jgi:hypothetical protein
MQPDRAEFSLSDDDEQNPNPAAGDVQDILSGMPLVSLSIPFINGLWSCKTCSRCKLTVLQGARGPSASVA